MTEPELKALMFGIALGLLVGWVIGDLINLWLLADVRRAQAKWQAAHDRLITTIVEMQLLNVPSAAARDDLRRRLARPLDDDAP